MRAVRVAQLLTGAVLLVVPALFGPTSGRLLLITGTLTLVLGALWHRGAAVTLTAVQGVLLGGLAVAGASSPLAGALLGCCSGFALTGYLLSAEAADDHWPGLRPWLRRRGRPLLAVLATVLVLVALEALPVPGSVLLFAVGAVALVGAGWLALAP